MKRKKYLNLMAILVLFIANFMFGMESFAPNETGHIFQLGIGQNNNYDDLRQMPDRVREFFPHILQDGKITWYDILGVDSQAPEQEIRRAAQLLLDRLDRVQHKKEFQAVLTAQAEGLNELPFIVCYQKGDGVFYEIPEASLEDILSQEERDALSGMKSLTATWKRFYLMKAGVLSLLFFGPELYKYFEKSDGYERIKDNEFFQKAVKACSYLKEKSRSIPGKAVVFAAFGIYPLWKFWKLHTIVNLAKDYRFHTLNFREGLRVFCLKKYLHTTLDRYDPLTRTRYETNYYHVSDPLGYMWNKDVRKEFMPIRKAKVMQVLTWFSSIGLLGCLLL